MNSNEWALFEEIDRSAKELKQEEEQKEMSHFGQQDQRYAGGRATMRSGHASYNRQYQQLEASTGNQGLVG
jgi:hypothetical protein